MNSYLLKLTFFVTFSWFSLTIAHSQQFIDSTALDNFNNNVNNWDEVENENSLSYIKNGGFHMEVKKDEDSYTFWQNLRFDKSKDHTIETSIMLTENNDTHGYGIVWNLSDWNNYNSFLLSPNGYIKIDVTIEGKLTELKSWELNTEVKPINNYNKLKIVQTKDQTHFFLNDVEVYSCMREDLSTKGSWFGYLLYHKKKLTADYFKIKGSFPRMNIVAGAINGHKKENLGKDVNSTCTDLGPIISADGKTLYFFRKNCPMNVGGAMDANDDAWVSERQLDGKWGPAKNLGFPINNTGPNFVVAVSADNNTLFLANTYNKDGSPNSAGLSISNRTTTGWSVPEDINIEKFINNNKYVNFYVSQDRNYIISAIEPKDSYGDQDIYVSFKKGDNTYTEPMNIGNIVNTSGTEMSPFLASDNKTLYFSSDIHPGYGSTDIFVTRRLDDTWKNWSTPLNLGPEINTSAGDSYFTLPASGELAYLSSRYNSIGESDVIRMNIPTAAKPNPVVLIRGKVLNKKTNEPLEATINYYDISTNTLVGTAQSNPQSGAYNIILQSGKKYSFNAEKDKFYAVNDFLDVSTLNEYKEINKDLLLVPIEVGQTVRLNNIFFDFNKANLKPESQQELNRFAEFLKTNKTIEIEISGHTDNQGSDDYNIKLSQQRLESVLAYLLTTGVDKMRIKTQGYGKNKPVATNDTEEGRAINRRVEFTILKQ